MTKIFGHRGYSGKYPENTMLAFKKAYEIGADGIECDVQRSKDGVLVISHDPDLKRIVGENKYIKDLTYNELSRYNFSNMKEYNEKIPTLESLLIYAKDKDLILNLELKTDDFRYSGIERQTLNMVRKYDMEDQVIFSSFNFNSIDRLIKLKTSSDCAYLVGKNIFNFFKAQRSGLNMHPSLVLLKKMPFFDNLTKNIKLRIWTVNEGEDIKEMLDRKIEAIITNDIGLALKLRDEGENNGRFAKANN